MGVIAFLFAASANASAQAITDRVDVPGAAAMSMINAADTMLREGTPVSALRDYVITYAGSGGSYSVVFTSPSGLQRSFGPPSASLQKAATISGRYVSALYQTYQAWSRTAIAGQHPLPTIAVSMRNVFDDFYWVYFVPRFIPARGLAIGCGLEREFSVNITTGKVTPGKPVC